jgi:PRTRC genetic system protein C
MAIKLTQLERTFTYNGISLPDPGTALTLEQVRDVYSAAFPEIVSASIEGPEQKNGKLLYTFRKAVGSKG